MAAVLAVWDGVVANDIATIDSYTAALRSRLRGPARYRASLVAEAHDGLCDAAEAYQARGLDETTAQRRAVADFGELSEVLPAYQAELGVAQGRRVAMLLAVGCPVMQVSSGFMWRYLTPAAVWEPGPAYRLLASTVDIGSYAIAIAAVLALLGFGYGSRYFRGVRLARVVASGSLAAMVTISLGGAALTMYSPVVFNWPVAMQGMAWHALFGYATWAAVRCLAITPARDRHHLASC